MIVGCPVPAPVRALNDALAALGERHGAVLADVHGWFLGHGVVAGDPAQTEARPATGPGKGVVTFRNGPPC